MQPDLIFNIPNVVYWLTLALTIWIQGLTVGRRPLVGFETWGEGWRWLFGFNTLFWTGLIMVWEFGWDGPTWAALAVLTLASRVVEKDYTPLAELWRRRESARWTLQYFGAFLAGLGLAAAGRLELVTWLLMFASLGICGAVKVGCEAYRESVKAEALRRQGVHRNGQAD